MSEPLQPDSAAGGTGHRSTPIETLPFSGDASFRSILQAAPDGILLVDHAGTILFANSEGERLFGYGPGELSGAPVDSLVPERLRGDHQAHRAEYETTPRTRPMGLGLDLLATRKDGSEFLVEISLSTGAGENGFFVTAIVRDVTAHREAERVHERLLTEMEARLERERIAGDLHDDIIQSVYAAGMTLHTSLSDPAVGKKELVARANEALNAVIADLRSYIAQLQRGGATTTAEMFRARVESLVEGSGPPPSWSVRIRLEDSLPPELERHLYLILKELVSNVTRHSDAAHASLTVHFGEETVDVELEDDGIGFERAAVEESSLGLRSVEQRVADLGGSVLVESEPAGGTRVRASLPLRMRPDE